MKNEMIKNEERREEILTDYIHNTIYYCGMKRGCVSGYFTTVKACCIRIQVNKSNLSCIALSFLRNKFTLG